MTNGRLDIHLVFHFAGELSLDDQAKVDPQNTIVKTKRRRADLRCLLFFLFTIYEFTYCNQYEALHTCASSLPFTYLLFSAPVIYSELHSKCDSNFIHKQLPLESILIL